MRDFFRGWKRKVGVVTLILAVVLTGEWARNFRFRDLVLIQSGKRTIHEVEFSTNGVSWATQRWDDPDYFGMRKWFELRTLSYIESTYFSPRFAVKWHKSWFGFHFASIGNSPFFVGEQLVCTLPYWSIVLPLAILSALLLLSKQPPVKVKGQP